MRRTSRRFGALVSPHCSSLALCYAPLANEAVLFVPDLKRRLKVRRPTPQLIDCLAFGSKTCTTQPRNVGRFDEQWYSLRLVGQYGRRKLCETNMYISYRDVFFELGLGLHSFMSSPGFHHELFFREIRECLNCFSVNNFSVNNVSTSVHKWKFTLLTKTSLASCPVYSQPAAPA